MQNLNWKNNEEDISFGGLLTETVCLNQNSRIQSIAGSTQNIPTPAIETMLNLPPLDIYKRDVVITIFICFKAADKETSGIRCFYR